MRLLALRREIWLPRSRQDVFAYLSEARNLEGLARTWLGLQMPAPPPMALAEGLRTDSVWRLRGACAGRARALAGTRPEASWTAAAGAVPLVGPRAQI